MCYLFGKAMEQQDTTVLMGMLMMLSFAMGDAPLSVRDFWNEPVIVWMPIVLPTGLRVLFLRTESTLNFSNI